MGNLEKEVKKSIRNTKIQRAIIAAVGSAGLLAVTTLAPNAIQILGKIKKYEAKRKDKSIYHARQRLIEKELLKYDGKFLQLTKEGERSLEEFEHRDFKLPKPKKWDKKWRILIFDIKEKRRDVRDLLRKTLVSIGFVRLQNSVWIYPYDCEDLITLLKADFKIGRDVLYVIADRVENDKTLREQFNL